MNPQKLKRVPIKEELVVLTGDYKLAIVLQQMIYWNERCNDFDKFIEEENKRKEENKEDTKIEKSNGWIYKKAEQLSEETLMNVSAKQILRYLRKLEDKGWVEARNNPKYKWDKTLQYRLNLIQLMEDLNTIGYQLEGYAMFKQEVKEPPKKEPQEPKCPSEGSKCPSEKTKSDIQTGQNVGAIPESTLEITPEITSAKAKSQKNSKTDTQDTDNSNSYLDTQKENSDSQSSGENKSFVAGSASEEKDIWDMWAEPDASEINRSAIRKKYKSELPKEKFNEFLDAKNDGFNGDAESVRKYVEIETNLWDHKKYPMKPEALQMKFEKEYWMNHPIAKRFKEMTEDQINYELEVQ